MRAKPLSPLRTAFEVCGSSFIRFGTWSSTTSRRRLSIRRGAGTVDNDPLVMQIFSQANREFVFGFLSERDKMLRWTGLTLDIDPQHGGRTALRILMEHISGCRL
jgi:hypothetical protein